MSALGRNLYYSWWSKDESGYVWKDRTLKRKDVNAAIEQLSLLRGDMSNVTIPGQKDPANRFLRLPPEIRNLIYTFALDIGLAPASRTRAPYSSRSPRTQARSTTSLLLCKQTNAEANSLMKAYDIAYIPVMASLDFGSLIIDILQYGPLSLPPTQSTILAALTTFMNVHIHLHIKHWPSNVPEDEKPRLDANTAYIYVYLRQVLLIYACASALISQRLGQGSVKRKAIVHFDHWFSDWRRMLPFAGPYKFEHLIRLMGEDTNTNWEVRYYVYTGGDRLLHSNDPRSKPFLEWDERFTGDFLYFEQYCSKFTNIKLIPEVYGEWTWSLEEKNSSITRCITPSSTVWPSWPDDVPWRMGEREKSD